MNPTALSFHIPITSRSCNPKERMGKIGQLAEKYWDLGLRGRATIVEIHSKEVFVTVAKAATAKKSKQIIVVAAKVVSCALVFPLVLLGLKAIYRNLNHFKIKPQNNPTAPKSQLPAKMYPQPSPPTAQVQSSLKAPLLPTPPISQVQHPLKPIPPASLAKPPLKTDPQPTPPIPQIQQRLVSQPAAAPKPIISSPPAQLPLKTDMSSQIPVIVVIPPSPPITIASVDRTDPILPPKQPISQPQPSPQSTLRTPSLLPLPPQLPKAEFPAKIHPEKPPEEVATLPVEPQAAENDSDSEPDEPLAPITSPTGKKAKGDLNKPIYDQARAFANSDPEKAAHLYSKYVLACMRDVNYDQHAPLPRFVITAKSKVVETVNKLYQTHSKFTEAQFFEAVKYLRDLRQETEEEVVAEKLSRTNEIPLSKPALKELKVNLSTLAAKDIEESEAMCLSSTYSVATIKGSGTNNQDRFLISTFEITQQDHETKEPKEPIKVELYALMDGTNGEQSAQFVLKHLIKTIKFEFDMIPTLGPKEIWNALKRVPVKLDLDWKALHPNKVSGTSLCLAIRFHTPEQKDTLYTLNTGDSRAVFVHRDKDKLKAKQCSTDAIPQEKRFSGQKDFYKSLVKRGGDPKTTKTVRGIGFNKHPYMTARPEIGRIQRLDTRKEPTLYIASKGLWQPIGSTEVKGKSAKQLVIDAITKGSTEDTTVIKINFSSSS